MKIAATLAQLRQQRTEQQQQLAQLQAAAADRQARFGKNVQPFLDWAKQTNIPVAADFPLLAPTQQRHFLGTCVAVLHRELVQAQDEETRMRQMIAREQAALQEQEAQLTRQIEAADRAVAELELQLRQLETQLRAQQAGQKLRRQAAAEQAEARKQASPTWSVRTQTAAENTADWKSCLRRAEDCQQELEHLLAARQKLATAQAHLDELEARIREREPETPQPQPPDLGDL
ncbi:MAG: hypothetical protein IT579_18720 [Verrucomicrobia subdivision 3 bacterium]|nr:hypothetical protein [Limisphaerales bacterium]